MQSRLETIMEYADKQIDYRHSEPDHQLSHLMLVYPDKSCCLAQVQKQQIALYMLHIFYHVIKALRK